MTDKVESEAVSEGEVCIIAIDSGCVHMERVGVHCVGMRRYVQYYEIGSIHPVCVCIRASMSSALFNTIVVSLSY